MEKIIWTDCVKNEYYIQSRKRGDILHTIKRKKANGIGHMLHRKYLLKHVTEGKIRVEGQG